MRFFISKVSIITIIFTVILSTIALVYSSHFNGIVSLVLLLLIVVGFFYAYKAKSFVLFLLTMYAWFVGPFSISIASIFPSIFRSTLNHSITQYITDTRLVGSYCVNISVFYSTFLLTYFLVAKIRIFNYCRIKTGAIVSFHSLLFPAILLALIEYYVRIKYSISIPGKVPTAFMSGVILYLFQSFELFFLFLSLQQNVVFNNHIKLINIVNIIVISLVTQLPSIIIGQRGGVLGSLLLTTIFIFMVKVYPSNYYSDIRYYLRFFFPIFFVALIGVGITNIFRVGKFDTIGFLLNRFTGLLDGLIALRQLNQINFPFSLSEFFSNFAFGLGVTSNKYYTNSILGFPVSAIHSSALSIFIGEWFYGGIIGIVIITALECFFLTRIEIMIRSVLFYDSQINSKGSCALIFCATELILRIFLTHFLDGNITIWKNLVPVLICFFLASLSNYSPFHFTVAQRTDF